MSGAPPNDEPPARPRLWPELRWARWALVLLLAFTLLRGVVWSVSEPSFIGPDEDYHFLYIEHLTTQHSLPAPGKPLYTAEYGAAIARGDKHNAHRSGAPADWSGDPHALVGALGRLPHSAREPTQAGRGVGVVHPPLYHAIGWLVDAALGDASIFTRYDAIKWMTTLFGVLAVYAAWLLASQVFRREPPRQLVAFLVAVQPMVAFLSGIANHDAALIALFTLAVALMLFVLRTPPRARQGLWLGGAVALALLVKGSALVLVPLGALAYIGQGLAYRGRWRQVARSAALAAGVAAVLAGWWYVRAEIVYGSLAGYTVGGASGVPHGAPLPVTLDNLWTWTRTWIELVYKTYWWHHFWYEAPTNSTLYYAPAVVGGVGILGLLALAVRARRELLAPDRPLLRQTVLMVSAALALMVPILVTDLGHLADGLVFSLYGGRYLLPAYPAVATLLVVGLMQLFRGRAQPVALVAVALLAARFCWKTWISIYVHRYYGGSGTSWHDLLRHMSFDRPEFVTPTALAVMLGLALASLVGFALAVGTAALPPGARRGLAARRGG